ncbi:MAG: acyloxyacyl hydrolase [Bacteroidetes bacterium]|nr:acyloxyacyl hydrolase [Bacteroidota bacterium]
MRNLVITVLLLFLVHPADCQTAEPVFFSLSPKEGFLIAHRPAMSHLVRKNAYSFEFAAWQQVINNDEHTQRLRNPLRGISVEYRNFGYDEVLGKAISITGYMVFPLLQTKNNLFVDLTVGTGAGYLSRSYDPVENPLNNAIGSKWNGRVNLKFSVLKYFRTTHLGGGIEFMHFSNGCITTPNLGLNSPSVFLQLGYNVQNRVQAVSRSEIVKTKLPEPNNLTLELITSAKEIGAIPYFPKRYPVLATRLAYTYSKNGLWGAEAAIDVIHNEANFHKYADTTFVRNDILQVGIYAGTFIRFYKSQLAFGLGWYVRDHILAEGRMYNRIGYRYYFKPNWFALFNIKANYAKADYFEFGIGYKFLTW